jgi:hypothetical protein
MGRSSGCSSTRSHSTSGTARCSRTSASSTCAAGVLRRRAEWRSPAGASVRVGSTRLVSLAQRSAAAILYEVEPLDGPIRVVVQSELVANEAGGPTRDDPRAAAALNAPLQSEDFFARDARAILTHSTRRSGILMAAGMDHVIEGPDGTKTVSEAGLDVGRVTVVTELAPGERLRVIKFLAYGWSSERSLPAVRDQVVAAVTQARHTGWQGLADDQRAYLDEFWGCADVELEGDTELQQAVRFALFHTLQAVRLARRRLARSRRRLRRHARPRRQPHLRAPAAAAARTAQFFASSSAADDSRVEFDRSEATYTLLAGSPLLITHHGDRVEIAANAPLTKPIPALPTRAAPTQPTGREPARRKS